MSDSITNPDLVIDDKKRILAWAFYDWANSAHSTTVMASFFPLFLGSFWGAGLSDNETTFLLGTWNSIASLIVMIIAPILGAIADRMAGKKRFLAIFAFFGAISTGVLAFIAEGQYEIALVIYALSIIGFSGANTFYDSLLPAVASEKKVDYVSSLGFSLGYIGGGLLFTVNVVMYLFPELFGIANPDRAIQWSFLSVAIWWSIFTIPILLRVPEPPNATKEISFSKAIGQGFRQLGNTFREIRHLKYIGLFLVAFWLYIDGVDTIIRMALKYGQSLSNSSSEFNLTDADLVIMLLLVQFVAFPGTLLYNLFASKVGTKNGLFVAILGYIGITIFGYFISQPWHFYVIGGLVGLFQGGIQALSRSFYSRMIPKDKTAEFMGFFNMWGKFAAVIGPALMGIVTLITDDVRKGILSILILFVLGAFVLFFVDIDKAEEIAKEKL